MDISHSASIKTPPPSDEVAGYIAHFRAQLKDPAKPLALLGRFKVKDGTEQRLEAAFAAAAALTQGESGVISYDLNWESQNPTRVVVYERWKSLADLESHLRTPYIDTLRGEINAIIDGPPEFTVLTPVRSG